MQLEMIIRSAFLKAEAESKEKVKICFRRFSISVLQNMIRLISQTNNICSFAFVLTNGS